MSCDQTFFPITLNTAYHGGFLAHLCPVSPNPAEIKINYRRQNNLPPYCEDKTFN